MNSKIIFMLYVFFSAVMTTFCHGEVGIWISKAELASLPMSGTAWESVKDAADAQLKAEPNLSDRNRENVQLVAKALVYARTGDKKYRTEVVNAIMQVIGTEGSDLLANCRNLGGYVVSADLVDIQSDSVKDQVFRAWLRKMLDPNYILGKNSLVGIQENDPSNWGCAASFSRAAAAVYLRDTDGDAELERTAHVFKGWMGDRYSYIGFRFKDVEEWQCDPNKPVGINPKGCTKQGYNIDGVIPDDLRRGGGFKWPPPKENYVYTGLQGSVPAAVVLYRAGYDVWNWEDKAFLRAFEWLYDVANFKLTSESPTSDDEWLAWLIDYYYQTGGRFASNQKTSGNGKIMDWTPWTHALDRTSGIIDEVNEIFSPNQIKVYPNPFNMSTHINYSVGDPSYVTLTIYNLGGKKVKTLVSDQCNTGDYTVSWKADDIGSGLYIIKLKVGNNIETKKVLCLK